MRKLLPVIILTLAFWACGPSQTRAPQHFSNLLHQVPDKKNARMISDMVSAEFTLGVPQGLLLCLLGQQSQFDLKKFLDSTRIARQEMQVDRDHYDPNPNAELFSKSTTDFRSAVMASAGYLNNRYWQLKKALDRQKIPYDPQVLWIYAAAAYQRGTRVIFALWTQEMLSRGVPSLARILGDLEATRTYLTRPQTMDFALSKIWPAHLHATLMNEFVTSMHDLTSCVLPEVP